VGTTLAAVAQRASEQRMKVTGVLVGGSKLGGVEGGVGTTR
jgi:hypothetical protein